MKRYTEEIEKLYEFNQTADVKNLKDELMRIVDMKYATPDFKKGTYGSRDANLKEMISSAYAVLQKYAELPDVEIKLKNA